MSNTISRDTYICCLEMPLSGIITLILGDAQIQSFKCMFKNSTVRIRYYGEFVIL